MIVNPSPQGQRIRRTLLVQVVATASTIIPLTLRLFGVLDIYLDRLSTVAPCPAVPATPHSRSSKR